MKLFSSNSFWYIFAGLLIIPALFINLDLMTLNDDEAIRTIVAMEMGFSDNYIVPTWNGRMYFAKPPLFNWILIGFFTIFGGVSEFAARFPTVLFLLIYTYMIYFFSSKFLGKEYGILSGLLFLTCGRVLFWDSMLAYIDILYSLVTYSGLMVIFYQYQKGRITRMFLISYFLAGIGFLLKGFPTLLFQGITLFVFLWYKKDLKKLFHWAHFVGIAIFLVLISTYYIPLYLYGDIASSLDSLLDQSTRRTSIHSQYDYRAFFMHLLSYPFENIYHFLPWSIMAIYLLKRNILENLKRHDFLIYCSVIFLANILVYWVSVEVYPRYILMLVPLIFSALLYLHKQNYKENSIHYKIYFRFHQVLLVALIIATLLVGFRTFDAEIPRQWLKVGLGCVVFGFILYNFTKHKQIRLISFVCATLMVRILFNWFVLPERNHNDVGDRCRTEAIELGKEYADKELSIYKNSNIDLTSSVYIGRERQKIMHRVDYFETEGLSILDTSRYDLEPQLEVLGSICVRAGAQELLLVRVSE